MLHLGFHNYHNLKEEKKDHNLTHSVIYKLKLAQLDQEDQSDHPVPLVLKVSKV